MVEKEPIYNYFLILLDKHYIFCGIFVPFCFVTFGLIVCFDAHICLFFKSRRIQSLLGRELRKIWEEQGQRQTLSKYFV